MHSQNQQRAYARFDWLHQFSLFLGEEHHSSFQTEYYIDTLSSNRGLLMYHLVCILSVLWFGNNNCMNFYQFHPFQSLFNSVVLKLDIIRNSICLPTNEQHIYLL